MENLQLLRTHLSDLQTILSAADSCIKNKDVEALILTCASLREEDNIYGHLLGEVLLKRLEAAVEAI